MKRVPVKSSNLAAAGFEEQTSTLEIQFRSGSIYRYFSVPVRHFEGLTSASSPGGYFHRHIKDRYRFKQVR